MKKLMIVCSLIASIAMADEWVEVQPVSGDRVMIGDQEFILMTPGEFANMQTNFNILARIAKKQWDVQHSTEAGIRAWHGKRTNVSIDTNAMEKVTTYADGYQLREKMQVRDKPRATPRAVPKAARPFSKPKRLRDAEARKPVTVEVEAK